MSRGLTLVEAEAIEALAREHGIELAADATRRNVTTRGISLNDLVGRRFWVGEVLCQGTGPCEPCQYLVELTGEPLVHSFTAAPARRHRRWRRHPPRRPGARGRRGLTI